MIECLKRAFRETIPPNHRGEHVFRYMSCGRRLGSRVRGGNRYYLCHRTADDNSYRAGAAPRSLRTFACGSSRHPGPDASGLRHHLFADRNSGCLDDLVEQEISYPIFPVFWLRRRCDRSPESGSPVPVFLCRDMAVRCGGICRWTDLLVYRRKAGRPGSPSVRRSGLAITAPVSRSPG